MNLENILLFKGLGKKQIEKMLSVATTKEIPAGEIIIQEGERGSSLYILEKGTVDILKSIMLKMGDYIVKDKMRKLARLEAEMGVFFGEMAFIGEDERSATVKAVTDCTLSVIHREDFEKLAEGDCELGYVVIKNIAETLSHRLKQANEDVAKLTTALSLALSRKQK